MQLQIIIAHSTASNITLSDLGFYDCQENFVLPPADANAEVKEILSTTSEKSDRSHRVMQSPLNRNLDNRNHHGTSNMISPFSLQEANWDESPEKILLPPTDPNAEVQEISGYKLVYVNGACPRTYRVYTDDSMLGVIFQHITHWSNAVDKIRYAEPVDAAVGLDEFMTMTGYFTATKEEPPTEEELLDKEFDSLTSEEWERLKRYVLETSDLVAA